MVDIVRDVCKHCRRDIQINKNWSGDEWRHTETGKVICIPTHAEPRSNPVQLKSGFFDG